MIIVECYKDQALVYRMGFTPDQVGHERGRSRVLGRVEQEQKAVGIIDEDPFAGQPEYLREYDEKDSIGYHWFEHADEPAEGRFDGENSNYGLVNIKDELWEILVDKMTKVNGDIERIHQGRNFE